jgi:hypothetical protein
MASFRRAQAPAHVASPLAPFGRPGLAALLAGLAAFGLQALVVRAYAVNVPYWDEWDGFVGFVSRWQLGALHWSDWVAPHMEHRILVPRLAFALVSLVFGNANLSAALLISAALAGVTAGVWTYVLRRLGQPAWLAVASVPIIGTVGQYENILWGFQIQFYTLVLPIVAGVAIVALAPRITWKVIAALAAACTISMYSMASGALSWGIIGGVILLRRLVEGRADSASNRPWLHAAGFGAVAAAALATYFVGYAPVRGPAGDTFAPWVVARWAGYAFVFPILDWDTPGRDVWLPLAVLGIATPIVIAGVVYFKRRDSPRLVLMAGILAMVLANLAVTGYARGHQTWIASRYGTVFVWTSVLALFAAADLSRLARAGSRSRLLRTLAATVAVGIVAAQLAAYPRFLHVMDTYRANRLAFRHNVVTYLAHRSPGQELDDFVPFPKDRLKQMLDDQAFAQALPHGLRPMAPASAADVWVDAFMTRLPSIEIVGLVVIALLALLQHFPARASGLRPHPAERNLSES